MYFVSLCTLFLAESNDTININRNRRHCPRSNLSIPQNTQCMMHHRCDNSGLMRGVEVWDIQTHVIQAMQHRPSNKAHILSFLCWCLFRKIFHQYSEWLGVRYSGWNRFQTQVLVIHSQNPSFASVLVSDGSSLCEWFIFRWGRLKSLLQKLKQLHFTPHTIEPSAC